MLSILNLCIYFIHYKYVPAKIIHIHTFISMLFKYSPVFPFFQSKPRLVHDGCGIYPEVDVLPAETHKSDELESVCDL